MTYEQKLQDLLTKRPNDKFFRGCMDMEQLSELQKVWIDRYFYEDERYVEIYYKTLLERVFLSFNLLREQR